MPLWNATSPSQAKTYNLCPRRWWFEKISPPPGMPEQIAPTGSQNLGARLHAEIEKWLAEGVRPTDPLLQPTFNEWLINLPAPRRYVEWEFSLPVDDTDVACRGVIDFIDDADDDCIVVWDHKTTKSTRYIKSAAELAEDPQCLVYLYVASREFADADTFQFGHHYIRTDYPSSPIFVKVLKSRGEIVRDWKNFVALTLEMNHHASSSRPEGNFDSCWAYGGCPYRGVCHADNNDGLGRLIAGTALEGAMTTTPTPMFAPTTPTVLPTAEGSVYVDCAPSSSPPALFATWAAPIVEKWTREHNGQHPLTAPYQVGVREVALLAVDEWTARPCPLVVLTADPIGALFSTLVPAKNVVRRLG